MPTDVEASAYLHSMNERKRRLLPAFINDRVSPVYIFNIYPKEHRIILGSLGRYIIPACKEGAPYSEPLIVPGIYGEEFDLADGNGNMASNPVSGLDLAKDIVGITAYHPELDMMTTNLEWQGIFIAAGNKPTNEELQTAKAKLVRYATMILQDGDRLFAERDLRFQPTEKHREMAAWLKQKREWNTVPEQRTECPACGTNIRPNLAVCPSCGAVLDAEKAAKFFPDKYGKKAS